jgi:hypothetical protein
MRGFALIAVMLMVSMAVRVTRRGNFGLKTSVALKTLSPFPLGRGAQNPAEAKPT